MSLKLYNTLSKEKEIFTPVDVNNIRMYVCGPTLYNNPHIGNFRPIVIFDILFRLLQDVYDENKVTYVRNITDIDDKIINTSNELDISAEELVKKYKKTFRKDLISLNILEPTKEPSATEYIDQMVTMISDLISKGFAYESNKHVLFESKKFQDYGKLSRLSPKDIISGARVEIADYKKNPEDFVLWKPSKDSEPFWESPWGKGRPGWHMECSAMSYEILGSNFDIHGGGIDLIFPHHENEIAQSTCFHGEQTAQVWMHNGFVNFSGEKMSKSLGNIATVNDLLGTYSGDVIKYALLTSHYRQPLEFSDDLLNSAVSILEKWSDFQNWQIDKSLGFDKQFMDYLLDDLNTPGCLMRLQQIFNLIKKDPENQELKSYFVNGLNLIGLKPTITKKELKIDINYIENMISQRSSAKENKDFAKADEIRNALQKQGIILEDSVEGTKWKQI
ncbi:MAG: cysteine--tRNA ligase [Alphaproteobacteria bacterium]|nr:cysteine--tRNA ligase [Alphaproteobacteria bacterium]